MTTRGEIVTTGHECVTADHECVTTGQTNSPTSSFRLWLTLLTDALPLLEHNEVSASAVLLAVFSVLVAGELRKTAEDGDGNVGKQLRLITKGNI